MLEQMKLDLDTLCGRTSPEPSAQTAARTSARCSKKSAESSTKEPMFLDLTRGGGYTLENKRSNHGRRVFRRMASA